MARIGRPRALDVKLPDIEQDAQIIADWLHEREPSQRRPEQTARVLALVVALHRNGRQPWPIRRQVSEHTGVSLPMLDVVLNTRRKKGDIVVYFKEVSGNIKKHDSITTQTFYRPSRKLLALVKPLHPNC